MPLFTISSGLGWELITMYVGAIMGDCDIFRSEKTATYIKQNKLKIVKSVGTWFTKNYFIKTPMSIQSH